MRKYLLLLLVLPVLACGQPVASLPIEPTSRVESVAARLDDDIAVTPSAPEWTVCAWTLYVRSGPSTSASVQDVLERGDTVRVREWSPNGNGWAMIAPARWVNGDYLSRTGDCDGR